MTEQPDDERDESPSRRWRRRVFVGIGIVVVVAAVWAGSRAANMVFTTKASLARTVGRPVQVRVGAVTKDAVAEVIGGTTLAQPYISTSINVAVREGRVKRVHAELGKLVKAGDRLVEFDTDVFREALERGKLQLAMARSDLRRIEAEAQTRRIELESAVASAKSRVESGGVTVEQAALTYKRYQALVEQRVMAPVEAEQARVRWDDARATLAQAQLALVKAESELKNEPVVTPALVDAARFKVGAATQELAAVQNDMKNTVIVAPATGVVAQKTVDVGEWVKDGKTLFVIDLVSPLYAAAEIEQEKSAFVAVGQPAEVIFDAFPTQTLQGKIAKIDPTIDPVKRTFKSFVLLENSSLQLRPGMAAFTRLRKAREVVTIPRLALINPTGSPSVDAAIFVVEGGTATMRRIKVGRTEGVGRVEVLDGVRPGEDVVIYGKMDLNAGDRVNVTVVGRDERAGGPQDAATAVR